MRLNKQVVKNLPTEQIVALALYGDLAANHKDKIAKLLHRHDEPTDEDEQINILKLAALSQERGHFFDDDFIKVGEQAHYYDISNAVDAMKGLVKNAKVKVIDAYVPGAGEAGVKHEEKRKAQFKNFLQKIFSGGKSDISDGNPNAKNLRNAVLGDDPKKDDGLILGIKKQYFWAGVGGIVLLIVVLIVVSKMKRKQVSK